MSKIPKKPGFKELQDEWYKKLKDTGFNDIERGQERGLKTHTALEFRERSKYGRYGGESVQEYYYMAEHFLNNHDFYNQLDETIWAYHTNGLSSREITTLLKDVGIKTNRTTVCKVIKKYEIMMFKAARIEKVWDKQENGRTQ